MNIAIRKYSAIFSMVNSSVTMSAKRFGFVSFKVVHSNKNGYICYFSSAVLICRSKEFMLYSLTDGLVRPASSFFILYIIAYGVLEQGYTDYQAVVLRSTASFVGLTARPFLGMLTVFVSAEDNFYC